MFAPIFKLVSQALGALGIRNTGAALNRQEQRRLRTFVKRGKVASHRYGRRGQRAKSIAARRRLNIIAAESRRINR